MEIPAKFMEHRYHFAVATVFLFVLALLAYAAPRILNILSFFWPLFASTAAIVVLAIAFGGVSQFSGESHGEKAGEGLMDYVAGRPHYAEETHKYE